MSLQYFKVNASTLPLLLVTMCFLAGCQMNPTTNIAATEIMLAAHVCKVWQPVTYSSKDTDQTKLEVRANNAARHAYCQPQ